VQDTPKPALCVSASLRETRASELVCEAKTQAQAPKPQNLRPLRLL